MKLINLTKNEIVDIESVDETPQYMIPKYELMQIHKEINYRLKLPRPSHWEESDKYKVIED